MFHSCLSMSQTKKSVTVHQFFWYLDMSDKYGNSSCIFQLLVLSTLLHERTTRWHHPCMHSGYRDAMGYLFRTFQDEKAEPHASKMVDIGRFPGCVKNIHIGCSLEPATALPQLLQRLPVLWMLHSSPQFSPPDHILVNQLHLGFCDFLRGQSFSGIVTLTAAWRVLFVSYHIFIYIYHIYVYILYYIYICATSTISLHNLDSQILLCVDDLW